MEEHMLYRHSFAVKLAKKFREDGYHDPVGAAVLMGEAWYQSEGGLAWYVFDENSLRKKYGYLDDDPVNTMRRLVIDGWIETMPKDDGNDDGIDYICPSEYACGVMGV